MTENRAAEQHAPEPALAAAVRAFVDLGWLGADRAEVLALPLGTSEQQRAVVEGMRRGDWGEWGETGPGRFGWVSSIAPVEDRGLFALFGIRCGVPAKRAVRLLTSAGGAGDELETRVVASRGAAYAESFVREAAASARRAWEHATSRNAGAAVRLVAELGLPLPEHPEYLKDWAVYALGALTGGGELMPPDRGLIAEALIAPRYPEHARAAIALGTPATGPFGESVPAALERGWLSRTEAMDLAVAGLDAAQRPGDRKVWAALLTGPLGLTEPGNEAELDARTETLLSAIATGEAAVIEAFAPALMARADDALLSEILVLGLSAKPKKTKRALLLAAADRSAPGARAREELAALVGPLAAGTDAQLAKPARALLDAWGIAELGDGAVGGPTETEGALPEWRITPALWTVPVFSAGAETPAALTAAAARLTGRPESVVDLEVERFLALANAVARDDEAAARTALGGVRRSWVAGLRQVAAWRVGEPSPTRDTPPNPEWTGATGTTWKPEPAREAQVFQRLGAVPVLLSTPSRDDLSIDPADLAARLGRYRETGASASEADLLLALFRLDRGLLSPGQAEEFAECAVPVLTQDGDTMPLAAGPAVVRYLADPIEEPGLFLDARTHAWWPEPLRLPESLSDFPPRLKDEGYFGGQDLVTFPLWGDGAGREVVASEIDTLGICLRQTVTRATPLTPGLAANLIGAQRAFHRVAAEDGVRAIHEAWERGLLIPGVADPALLDWADTPDRVAAFATAARALAEEGLLAPVWPMLDGIVLASVRAPRLLAGTAELVDTIEALVPAVAGAVAAGLAPDDSLALPGVRLLAEGKGSSRAVTRARAICAALPPVATGNAPAVVPEPAAVPELDDAAFAALWPVEAGNRPAVDDGAEVRAAWQDPAASTRLLEIELRFPSPPSGSDTAVFRTRTAWFYDLTEEGQCGMTAIRSDSDAVRHDSDAWLRWDGAADSGAIVVSPTRNWREGTAGPAQRGGLVPPLTTGLIAVFLGSHCHDNASDYYAVEAVRKGLFGAAGVGLATRRLLGNEDFSPVKLVKIIEEEPDTIAALWPVLTEGVRRAAELPAPPRWLNRVLDVALARAELLRAASRRGLLGDAAVPDSAWPGLAELAARPGKSTAFTKARRLREALGQS